MYLLCIYSSTKILSTEKMTCGWNLVPWEKKARLLRRLEVKSEAGNVKRDKVKSETRNPKSETNPNWKGEKPGRGTWERESVEAWSEKR